jgi:hypothetical protein
MRNGEAAAPPPGLHRIAARAAILVPLTVGLWWFLLKDASLWLLRLVSYVPLLILIAPSGMAPVRVDPATGEWVFNAGISTAVADAATGSRHWVESVEFAASPENVAFFTCGWFSYLALAASVRPFSREHARRSAIGFGLQTAVNVISLCIYVFVNGYGSVVNTASTQPVSIWILKYVYHLIYLVVPFFGPFLIAVLTHPAWRNYFLHPTTKTPRGVAGIGKATASAR